MTLPEETATWIFTDCCGTLLSDNVRVAMPLATGDTVKVATGPFALAGEIDTIPAGDAVRDSAPV
jgi:hypothetical protein